MPEKSIEELIDEYCLLSQHEMTKLQDGFSHPADCEFCKNGTFNVFDWLRTILTNERKQRDEAVKAVKEKLSNLWLDIHFLDKYSEDEHYWKEEMGNNHCVEMHISDFERLRKAFIFTEDNQK